MMDQLSGTREILTGRETSPVWSRTSRERLRSLPAFFLLATILLLTGTLKSSAQSSIRLETAIGDSIERVNDTLTRLSRPDISITAKVTARELSFDEVGNASLTFHYNGQHDTLFSFTGWNIPVIPMPNVTLKNIGLLLVIEGAFRDLISIAEENLPSDSARSDSR